MVTKLCPAASNRRPSRPPIGRWRGSSVNVVVCQQVRRWVWAPSRSGVQSRVPWARRISRKEPVRMPWPPEKWSVQVCPSSMAPARSGYRAEPARRPGQAAPSRTSLRHHIHAKRGAIPAPPTKCRCHESEVDTPFNQLTKVGTILPLNTFRTSIFSESDSQK